MLWHQAWEVHYFQIHLGRIRRSNCDIDTDRVWCERPITLTQYAQVHFNTASISHYTEIRKETLEEETAASTVSSVVWNVSEALFLLHSHISLTVNLCTDFPCQILSSFLPLHPCCREFSKFLLFLFVFFGVVVRSFVLVYFCLHFHPSYHSLLWRYIDCYVCSINVAITNVFGSKLSNIKI